MDGVVNAFIPGRSVDLISMIRGRFSLLGNNTWTTSCRRSLREGVVIDDTIPTRRALVRLVAEFGLDGTKKSVT